MFLSKLYWPWQFMRNLLQHVMWPIKTMTALSYSQWMNIPVHICVWCNIYTYIYSSHGSCRHVWSRFNLCIIFDKTYISVSRMVDSSLVSQWIWLFRSCLCLLCTFILFKDFYNFVKNPSISTVEFWFHIPFTYVFPAIAIMRINVNSKIIMM